MDLPDNVISHIFKYLSPRDLISCSAVCLHWNEVYYQLDRNDKMWWEFTKRDFNSVYKSAARRKSVDGCNWHNIYRSLSLWPEIQSAKEEIVVFAESTKQIDRIRDFALLKSCIGVLKHNRIIYYDTNNIEMPDKSSTIGHYMEYSENEELIALLTWDYTLQITRKFKNHPTDQENEAFHNVTQFLLHDNKVYFVKFYYDAFMCDFNECKIQENHLFSVENRIKGLNYTNKLYAITNLFEIVYYENQVVHKLNDLDDQLEETSFKILCKNNLFKYLKLQSYVKLVLGNSCPIPMSVVTEATTIVAYGNIIALGTSLGRLHLYNRNNDTAVLLKVWSFDYFPILKIEIVEMINGHLIYVALSNKIVMIKLSHDKYVN